MVTQAMIELFLPTIDGVGFQTMGAAQLDDRRAGLPLLQDGELLLGGNAAASAAFNRWTLVHLHKVIQAFQTVQISTGADQVLDFETFGTAIPIFDGTGPYAQIPFQFSLHIVRKPGAKPEHHKFLAEGREDPRAEFMRQLKTAVESKGTILAFNASFEKARLRKCAELMPKYQTWVAAVNDRVVDLLIPFRAFNFYSPDQQGSASMKWVLPALTGRDYTGLEIQEGGMASREFVRVTFAEVSESERKRVRKALELYCGQDTEGMVWILDALREA
jgi:hypothetical protein